MKTRLAVLFAVGAAVSSALAATWSTNYSEVGGAGSAAALVTSRAPDGRILLAGVGGDEISARILTVDGDGNPLWSVAFPFPGARMIPNAGTFTSDGGAVVVSIIGLGPDSVMMKFDASGNIVWQRLLPGNLSGNLNQFLNAIVEAPNGDLVAVGTYLLKPSQGANSAWVVRFNANGDILWSRTFVEQRSLAQLQDVVLVGDDAIAVGWGTTPQVRLLDVLAMRIDPTGKLLWETWLGSQNEDSASVVTRLSGGDFALAGSRVVDSTTSTCVPFLARFDGDGSVIWQESVTNAISGVCYGATGAAPSTGGGFAVAGFQSEQGMIHAVSESGVPIYRRTYGYVHRFHGLRATPEGGYVAGGELGQSAINAETLDSDGLVSPDCPSVSSDVPSVSNAGLSARRGNLKMSKAPQASIPSSIEVHTVTYLPSDICRGPAVP